MRATAKDLRFYSKQLLETVEQGEEVIITYRGKPRAKLVPISVKNKEADKKNNRLFGIWKDNEAVQDVNDYVRNLRKGRF